MTLAVSTPTVIAAQAGSLAEKIEYARHLAKADMLPREYRDKPGNVLLAVEYAQSLGIPAGQVLAGSVHVIDGKPSMSAQLMQALVRRAGHRVRGGYSAEMDAGWAEIVRRDDPEYTYHAEFSMADAKRAGVLGKDNWRGYPRAMLKARAMAEVCREACGDVLAGVAYTPDELGAMVVDGSTADDPPERPLRIPPIQQAPESEPDTPRFGRAGSPGSNTIPGPNTEPPGSDGGSYAQGTPPAGPIAHPGDSERERYAAAGRHAREVAKWEDNLALATERRDRAALRTLAETARMSEWPIRSELVARAREAWVKVGQDLAAEMPQASRTDMVDADPDDTDSDTEE